MIIKAKDVIAQTSINQLQDVSTKLKELVKIFMGNPMLAQLKPTLDKLVTEYKQFMTKQQSPQTTTQTTETTQLTAQ